MNDEKIKHPYLGLRLAVLGVVFGDIGTSPLYAVRQCFYGVNSVAVNEANVLGILSLIFWSLIIVISLKYLVFVMRADNAGEGGIIALVALLMPLARRHPLVSATLIPLGMFGAALLYGDGTITPAISVLSAMEGLAVINSRFQQLVVPLTLGIIVALFWFQRRGTASVGRIFGPIMLLWFITLGALGVLGITQNIAVLHAINPLHSIQFFSSNGFTGLLVLGTIFLVVTGGEALYADMGHFGIAPIRRAWFMLALPTLLLNYFGQGALILSNPQEASHPFFHLAPDWFVTPLIVIASFATIVASQAIITGTFSLTNQAMQLGFLPRMRVAHTSAEERGQIYIPFVNWLLMFATLALVLGFRSSDKLGAAYGLAVSADMAITTLLAGIVCWQRGWNPAFSLVIVACLLCVDLSFLTANSFKIIDGGWYPLLVGLLLFIVMSTWRNGRKRLLSNLSSTSETLADLLALVDATHPQRLFGSAVFLTSRSDATPPILLQYVMHGQVLHDQVILLNVKSEEVPRVPAQDRIVLHSLGSGFHRVTASYGYMQNPHVPALLKLCNEIGLEIDLDNTTYFLGRETILDSDNVEGLSSWRVHLFAFLSRNAMLATAHFHIPAERVIELGVQIEL